jgi:guanylate kinase
MSLIAQTLQLLTAGSRLIGPGRLVLVVGPSGSGKDTLIAGARAACRADGTVVFPRRVVTRPPSPAEDNDVLSPPAFAEAAARGDFALFWNAHGHDYASPRRSIATSSSDAQWSAMCRGQSSRRRAGVTSMPSRSW